MNVQYHRLTDAGFAYAVRMPERMHAGLPMIIQLHGAGERGGGEDLEKAEIHGLANILTETREEDCVLIEPRCPEGSFWVAMLPELKRFVCCMIEAYACDPDRVTLTGLSMGGYGTWFLAMAAPELFAAIAPCCGGGMPWAAGYMKGLPVWAHHGALDGAVDVSNSIDMYKALKRIGSEAKLTIYPDCEHDCWTPAFTTHGRMRMMKCSCSGCWHKKERRRTNEPIPF